MTSTLSLSIRNGIQSRSQQGDICDVRIRLHVCRAKLKAIRHCLREADIDVLAAAAHGFVGADLAAVCDEAAMAALRRIIASKQHPSPSPLPNARPLAEDSQTSLDNHHPAWSEGQVTAKDQQISSPQVGPTLAQSAKQAAGTPSDASLTGHPPDSGVASSSGDKPGCVDPSGSASAQAVPCGEATGPAANRAHQCQVGHCLFVQTPVHDCA